MLRISHEPWICGVAVSPVFALSDVWDAERNCIFILPDSSAGAMSFV